MVLVRNADKSSVPSPLAARPVEELEVPKASTLDSRKLAGVRLAISSPRQAAIWICQAARERSGPCDIHLVNSYTISLSTADDKYRYALREAAVNFPDGKPLAVVTKWSSRPLQQVRGPGLFEQVMDIGRQYHLKHYLLGSTDDTLSRLQTELERRYPGVEIAGTCSPPFRKQEEGELAAQDEMIQASDADVVWVGLGTPKQDYEAQRISSSLGVVSVAVGAAFDFVAGTKPEAPKWVRAIGFEWLFRLCCEPRRLWKRYLIGNFRFLLAVAGNFEA